MRDSLFALLARKALLFVAVAEVSRAHGALSSGDGLVARRALQRILVIVTRKTHWVAVGVLRISASARRCESALVQSEVRERAVVRVQHKYDAVCDAVCRQRGLEAIWIASCSRQPLLKTSRRWQQHIAAGSMLWRDNDAWRMVARKEGKEWRQKEWRREERRGCDITHCFSHKSTSQTQQQKCTMCHFLFSATVYLNPVPRACWDREEESERHMHALRP